MKDESLDSTNTEVEQLELFDKGVLNGSTNLADQNGADDPESSSTRCSFCSTKVDRNSKSTYVEVSSFVRGETKDSAVLRKYTGRYSCESCVNKLKAGIAPDQPNLDSAMDSESEPPKDQDLPTDQSESYLAGYRDGSEDSFKHDPAISDIEKINPEEYETGYIAGKSTRKSQLSILPVGE